MNWIASDWVGLGWSVDQVDIVRTGIKRENFSGDLIQYRNEFSLILNGSSYTLRPANSNQLIGRYYADGAPELYVERFNDCSGDADCYNNNGGSRENKTTEYFIVKTAEGTTYRLG